MEALIEAVKIGDRKAQTQLYSLYSKAMYNICLRMLIQEDKAKDALQDSFIKVFQHIINYKHESSIGAWIKRIVINKCLDEIKKEKRGMIIYQEEIQEDNADQEYSDDQEYQIEKIQKNILELPEGYRIVFSLFAIEDYSHKEIANLLNISESTSKSQYFKAKNLLKKKLQNG